MVLVVAQGYCFRMVKLAVDVPDAIHDEGWLFRLHRSLVRVEEAMLINFATPVHSVLLIQPSRVSSTTTRNVHLGESSVERQR